MDPEALKSMVAEDRAAGRRPFLVVPAAGTTNTGAIDPMEAVADVAEAEELWMHVDAAYGGFFQLTERGNERFRGIERADSITFDPHKGMFLPYGTGSLVVRDGPALRDAHYVGAEYLQDRAPEAELPNWNEYSPELSRDHRGFRVWLPLVLHGVQAFREALDEKLDLAEHLYAALSEMPEIELPWSPQLSVVPFRLTGASDDGNRAFLARINDPKRVYLSSTTIDGRHIDPGVHRESPHASRPYRRGDRDRAVWPSAGLAVPEMPEVQALAERLDQAVGGATLEGFDLLQFSSLKTVTPRPVELVGRALEGVERRGKYLVLGFERGDRMLVHLSQGGRLDVEIAAEVDEAEGLGRAIAFQGEAFRAREGVREGTEGGRLVARGR